MYTFRSSPRGRHLFQVFLPFLLARIPAPQRIDCSTLAFTETNLVVTIRVLTVVKTSALVRPDAGLLHSARQPHTHSETPLKIQKSFGLPHPLGVEVQLSLLVSACISLLATVGTAQTETWVLPKTPRFTPSLSHSE